MECYVEIGFKKGEEMPAEFLSLNICFLADSLSIN